MMESHFTPCHRHFELTRLELTGKPSKYSCFRTKNRQHSQRIVQIGVPLHTVAQETRHSLKAPKASLHTSPEIIDDAESLPAEKDIHAIASLDLSKLMAAASRIRDKRPDSRIVTFSPKVFIPVTKLCRDTCGYCTFAESPEAGKRAFMTEEEVLEVARKGAEAGCTEALFTLGDKPELRYEEARKEVHATSQIRSSVCLIHLGNRGVLSFTAWCILILLCQAVRCA